jgi:hypothetical protein
MLARLARIALLAAFVLAQHTALAHQIWHLGGHSQQTAFSNADSYGGDAPQSNLLCDFHSALSAALGALDSTPIAFPVSGPYQNDYIHTAAPAVVVPALPPASRGPPLS